MGDEVRVRFAPSPTGLPHIGNIRTALFNWLFARHHGGKFIVRVEDTDQERLVPGASEAVLDALDWLDLQWDEGPRVEGPLGPYYQSQRLDVYREAAEKLMAGGFAYRCFCSEERLEQLRKEQLRSKNRQGYDRRCRSLSTAERKNLEAQGGPSVVRFAMPVDGVTALNDLIHGEVVWQNDLLDDFILLKSDGFPTYHLAVVTDDHLMKVTHVLRAEEWLPSTPRHLQIYQALQFEPPKFGHLPMILGPDRAKLSKRHGATAAEEYRDDGFLPEAMLNFMALLGWSLDDKTEVMDRGTLVQSFSLERINKSAAIFDLEKLVWMNGVYIRQLSVSELAERILPFLERELPPSLLPVDQEYLLRIVPLIRERIKLLADAAHLTSYFFEEELDYEAGALVQKGMEAREVPPALEAARDELGRAGELQHEPLEQALRAVAADAGLKPRQFFGLLRVAVTGRDVSPPLFETMEALGKERVLFRIDAAIGRFQATGRAVE